MYAFVCVHACTCVITRVLQAHDYAPVCMFQGMMKSRYA